jgi:uncharacterized protein YcbX
VSTVERLWRHPVKSMRGEELDALQLVDGGVLGDRVRAFFAVESGERISAKQHGALLNCAARYLAEPTIEEPVPPLEVEFPDGAVVRDDDAEVTRRVSELLGFEVRMATDVPGVLVDLAPVHVAAAGTLRWLADQYPEGEWSPRRFRPNLLLDDGPDAEDGWLGCDLRVGPDAVLHMVMPTPRCVVTTRAQRGMVDRDQKILRTLAKVRKRDVPVLGESGCVGAYGDVVRVGVVRVGDSVTIEQTAPRRGAIAAALDARAQRA